MQKKYSDWISTWLAEAGYTHCFFVAGGNIMHLLESLSHHLTCIPTVHEVAAGIAAEYFNATSADGSKALALVTAGPGLTNIVTALSGAYLESRELLVLGGQALFFRPAPVPATLSAQQAAALQAAEKLNKVIDKLDSKTRTAIAADMAKP